MMHQFSDKENWLDGELVWFDSEYFFGPEGPLISIKLDFLERLKILLHLLDICY